MKQIFLAIEAAIKAAVPEIKHIDFDLGQLEQETPPVSYPCVLIGFGDASFIDFANNVQQGSININLRIAFKVLEKTHSKIEASYREQAIAHLDTLQNVKKAVTKIDSEFFTPPSRTFENNEKRNDIRVYNQTFSTTSYDDTAKDTFTPWQQIPNTQGTGPALMLATDIIAALNLNNQIPFNQSQNYHETLDVENLNLEGELIEI